MSVNPRQFRADGGLLTVRTDEDAPGGPLPISLQFGHVAVAVKLGRDQVRELVQSLDDWLLDSRPT